MIATRAFSLHIGDKPLVAPLDLRVDAGEVVALVGPNGVGKSTLLRALAGDRLASPLTSTGETLLDDVPTAQWRPADAALRRAVVRQHAQIGFPISVDACVRLGAMPHRMPRNEEDRLVAAALRRFDLKDLRRRAWSTLSGGERQRVGLARACVQLDGAAEGVQRTLLADEPTASMDLRRSLDALGELRALARDGVAVLVVLHDLQLAARFADRLVLLVPPGRSGWDAGAATSFVGIPREVITAERLAAAYGVPCEVRWHSAGGLEIPAIIPAVADDPTALGWVASSRAAEGHPQRALN